MDDELELKRIARSYKAQPEFAKIFQNNQPYILCGVTAAGKNVLERYLIAHGPFAKVVTHTTRKPRKGEQNGKDYWFVGTSQMLEMAKSSEFIEMQVINDYVYGVSKNSANLIAQSDKHPILNINVQGAINLSKLMSGLRPILLIPPSYYVWMQRLGSRSKISDGERERRMHSSHLELEQVLPNRDFTIVINDEVSRTGEAIIKGLSTNPSDQRQSRKLAQELFDYIRNQ